MIKTRPAFASLKASKRARVGGKYIKRKVDEPLRRKNTDSKNTLKVKSEWLFSEDVLVM